MNSVTQPTEPPAAATALRACADLAETAVCLARLAGTAAQADFCGVFLLDYTGTELLLRAVWHAGAGNQSLLICMGRSFYVIRLCLCLVFLLGVFSR